MERMKIINGAKFGGILELPIIKKPSSVIIPKFLVPFSERTKIDSSHIAVCFYEMDKNFSEILSDPAKYIEELRKYQAVISPDFSIYRDDPLFMQIEALSLGRTIGSFWQRRGLNVIPNIRWGSEDTYTTSVLPEKIAFSGVAKHSIVAIGSYGCIRRKEDRYHFEAGLEAMMNAIEPEIVLVYGAMPEKVFGQYFSMAKFVQYDNWTKTRHERRF